MPTTSENPSYQGNSARQTAMDEPTPPAPAAGRLASIDAYRGLVMFLMMAEVLRLSAVARAFPDSPVWTFLAHIKATSNGSAARCTI